MIAKVRLTKMIKLLHNSIRYDCLNNCNFSFQQALTFKSHVFCMMKKSSENVNTVFRFTFWLLFSFYCLQCFDGVGWVAGRASGM